MAQTGSDGLFRVGGLLMRYGVRYQLLNAAPTNGTSGTGAGKAAPGSAVIDSVSGIRWANVGTKASPTWSPLSPVSFNLTAANIIAMNATPVNLIAAPPAGFVILIDNVIITMTRTSTQFTGGGVVTLPYTGGSAAHTGSLPASVVTGAAGVVITQLGPATGANGTTVPTATGVDITNATAAFAAGTGTMKVNIDYRVVAQ